MRRPAPPGCPSSAISWSGAPRAAGELRPDLEWQDIPMIVCGLGGVTPAPPPPSVGRWPRLVETDLDGLKAPTAGTLPKKFEY